MAIVLVKVFVGSTTYGVDHEANYTILESSFNALEATLSNGGVPYGMLEIYDRAGVIGKTSYKPVEATLAATLYNLTVLSGAYWTGGELRRMGVSTLISMVPFTTTATHYVNVPTGGVPTVSASPTADTVWQFAWNNSTKVVSAVALYSGRSYLFSGKDYADTISGFDSIDQRLDSLATQTQQYAERSAAHSGLTFGYYGGIVHNDNTVSVTADGTIALTDATTNYIEVDPTTGTVSKNTTAFTTLRIPLFTVVTSGGAMTTITDKRSSSRATHPQNTDVGTSATEFKLNRLHSGTPTLNASVKVERGSSNDVEVRWNESTDKWQFTNDGTTYSDMGTVSDLNLGAQALSKYKALEDPILILSESAVSSDGAYVQKNLGPSGSNDIADAAQGVAGLVLRVAFWDSTPGSGVFIQFRQYGSSASPTNGYKVFGGTAEHSEMQTIIVPGDNTANTTIGYEKKITASGANQANVKIWLLGYFIRVTGVGSQRKTFTSTGNAVTSSSSTNFNKTGFFNRGLVYNLTTTETGGTSTGTYDINIYSSDTFGATKLLYSATGISSTADSRIFTDRLPFMYFDEDSTTELHIKITNNDGAQNMTFTIDVTAEQFA